MRANDLKFILEGVKAHGFTDDLKRFCTEENYYEWLLSTGIYRAFLFRKDFHTAFIKFLEKGYKIKNHKLTEENIVAKLMKPHDPMDFLEDTLKTHKLNLKKEDDSS